MKNLKTLLLLPLFFNICNSVYSQKQENPKNERIYIKKHIKGQIKGFGCDPDYHVDFDRKKDTLRVAAFKIKNKPEKYFRIVSHNGVQKKEILFLIDKYNDPMTPLNVEAGVKFNRYFLCEKDNKYKFLCENEKDNKCKCVNADEIKVYPVKGYK
jgi:hypothetical protein